MVASVVPPIVNSSVSNSTTFRYGAGFSTMLGERDRRRGGPPRAGGTARTRFVRVMATSEAAKKPDQHDREHDDERAREPVGGWSRRRAPRCSAPAAPTSRPLGVVLVVVAEQVQDAVHDQQAELGLGIRGCSARRPPGRSRRRRAAVCRPHPRRPAGSDSTSVGPGLVHVANVQVLHLGLVDEARRDSSASSTPSPASVAARRAPASAGLIDRGGPDGSQISTVGGRGRRFVRVAHVASTVVDRAVAADRKRP